MSKVDIRTRTQYHEGEDEKFKQLLSKFANEVVRYDEADPSDQPLMNKIENELEQLMSQFIKLER